MNRIDFRLFARQLTLLSLVAVFALTFTSLTGCKGETNEDGAQIELGDPD